MHANNLTKLKRTDCMDSFPSNLKQSKVLNRGYSSSSSSSSSSFSDYYYVAREMKACENSAYSLPLHVALFEELESTATVAFEQINKSINE